MQCRYHPPVSDEKRCLEHGEGMEEADERQAHATKQLESEPEIASKRRGYRGHPGQGQSVCDACWAV